MGPVKVVPRLKPLPYSAQDLQSELRKPTLNKHTTLAAIEFYSNEDNPNNKRAFKYKPCRPNPAFQSLMYSTTDLPPFKCRLSYFDKSPGILVNGGVTVATTPQGWRSVRTNVVIREGSWYIEFRIIKSNDGESNVRFGIARREASLEAPVGFDGYGYGMRDKYGQTVHLSKQASFLESEEFKSGDVVGLLVKLPPIELQRQLARQQVLEKSVAEPQNPAPLNEKVGFDIVRDQIPIKYKGQLYFEQYDYSTSKEMEHLLNPVTVFGEKAVRDTVEFEPCKLPGSSITIYKNGEKKGVAFENLYAFLPPSSEQKQGKETKSKFFVSNDDGSLGYYPMVSCYNRGIIELSDDSEVVVPEDLKAAVSAGEVKLYGQRYDERVLEEYVYDLVDEATNQYLDELEKLAAVGNQ
ncbi:hypothetical protein OGAPHI_000460 [Ogataea philodendri]|uniref:B30.2/SPRY domain-containing protein n=1 Tax=Ogataea philodendri TaxID=1378263 RepID=A0A9P8PHS2_9ASCO|nr:uncharacterized protein OGAPHI_000460 [Ogataea philodendri]KAH3671755.1 hypothetical protein OGAPHI_000460 [Ogataea philodendri]